jgi:hypothetical protein
MPYSAEVLPLSPVLKLSMKRTVFFSKGTVVPPEVTNTIGFGDDTLIKADKDSSILCCTS